MPSSACWRIETNRRPTNHNLPTRKPNRERASSDGGSLTELSKQFLWVRDSQLDLVRRCRDHVIQRNTRLSHNDSYHQASLHKAYYTIATMASEVRIPLVLFEGQETAEALPIRAASEFV